LTIRSNTGGGGPSIDSKATVGPLLAIAKESLPAPPLAQPPSPHAIASSVAAIAARGAVRLAAVARNGVAEGSLIVPCDIVKTC
jgi:hypothetical protein